MHLALVAFLLASPLVPLDESGFHTLVQSNKGNIVLYDFWATWCAPCRAEMPQLVKLQRKLAAHGFKLVTISADDPEQAAEAARFIAQAAAPHPAYRKDAESDEECINAIDRAWSGALPAMFLYDRNGRRVRSFIGETDPATIERAVAAIK